MLPVEEYGQVKNTKGVIKWKYVPKDTIVKTIDFIDNDLLD
jgi:hypothetical protein